jgi:hypothetical protein
LSGAVKDALMTAFDGAGINDIEDEDGVEDEEEVGKNTAREKVFF